jgi:hypothetical protein
MNAVKQRVRELFFIAEGAGHNVTLHKLLGKQTQGYSFNNGTIFVIDPFEVHHSNAVRIAH